MTEFQRQEPLQPIGAHQVGALAGHAVISEVVTHETQQPRPELRIAGDTPVEYSDARTGPYIGSAERGLQLRSDEQAIEYAQSLFPDTTFDTLGDGRYGIVLADDQARAYKVYRNALAYSEYEREAGARKLIGEAGLGPKMHLFVDAGKRYRLDRKAHDGIESGFEDVQIPRQASERELPVLVMDRVDTAPMSAATPERRTDGFCRAAEFFLEHRIVSWDTEVETDTRTGELTILDVGGLSQLNDTTEPANIKAQNDARILDSLALDYGMVGLSSAIIKSYQEGGMPAVHGLVGEWQQRAS